MSTETLKQDLKTKKSPVPVHPFITMLQASEGEIKKALPSHLKPERMIRIALTAFRRNPKLAECDPRSVLAAVIQSAQLGLEPDTLGRSYFVPYKTECQFIPGWKGLVDLVNRAGNASVWTGAVYEGDEFDYALGDKPFIQHRPTGDDDPDKLRYAYAVGRVKGSEWPVIEVWTMKRVWNHRDRYNKVGKSHYSYSNQEMYARKVTLLQVLKYMPMSPELTLAMELDHFPDDDFPEFRIPRDDIDPEFPLQDDGDNRFLESPALLLNRRLDSVTGRDLVPSFRAPPFGIPEPHHPPAFRLDILRIGEKAIHMAPDERISRVNEFFLLTEDRLAKPLGSKFQDKGLKGVPDLAGHDELPRFLDESGFLHP